MTLFRCSPEGRQMQAKTRARPLSTFFAGFLVFNPFKDLHAGKEVGWMIRRLLKICAR